LTWISGKSYPQSGASRKNSPGLKVEHTEALAENHIRKIQQELMEHGASLAPAGPPNDPAGVTGLKTVEEVYEKQLADEMVEAVEWPVAPSPSPMDQEYPG
jgi:hypothetical protein